MKNLPNACKTTWSVSVFVLTSLLTGCQSDKEHDLELVKNQWTVQSSKPIINQGKVLIKREPFGSIRATVFQGQIPAYAFSLDREMTQNFLTGDLEDATTYLTSVGEFQDGLVIDDQQTGKRYVLSYYNISSRLKDLPSPKGQTVFIKGYSTGLERLTPAMAPNLN